MAYALVPGHQSSSHFSTGTGLSCQFPAAVAIGNLLVYIVMQGGSGNTYTSPSDGANGLVDLGQYNDAAGVFSFHAWATKATTNAAVTFTVTSSASNESNVFCCEFSGAGSSVVQDGAVAGADTSATAPYTVSTPPFTALAHDLLINAIWSDQTLGSVSTPWTMGFQDASTQNGWAFVADASAGSVSPNASITGSTAGHSGSAVFGIQAGGAGTPSADVNQPVTATDTAAVYAFVQSIQTTDIEYHLSANAGSLGGAIAGAITGGAPNNVWDDVSGAESTAGDTEYRCVYVKNAHPLTSWSAPKVWIDGSPTPDSVAIALDSAAVGATAASTSAAESSAPTGGGAPYTFTSPTDKATGLQIADIPAGQYKAIWLRRTVPSSAAANPTDAISIRAEGDTI